MFTYDSGKKKIPDCPDGGAIERHNAFWPITFEPYVRFSKMRYRWNRWIKTSSTHYSLSKRVIIDFPEVSHICENDFYELVLDR